MIKAVNVLLDHFGTHENIAEILGYTDRQYRNIRRKIERGEDLPPRIASLINMKFQEIRPTTGADHDHQ